MTVRNAFVWGAIVMLSISVAACSKSSEKAAAALADGKVAAAEHTHDGWWCSEHGVPEDVCAQCDPKLVADFKAKGDWCEKHNRPESQCFICHPEKEAEFAALYEAKYGAKPPKPEAM
ncbi:MAG TPA: RND transporter [Lacipirellulaceae bacterium]|nr:RND transporter [Lacipirellulaceae bacterium]